MKRSLLPSIGDCLVVGSAIVIGFFVNGTARLSGLYFVAFPERYNTGRAKASIPFILVYSIRNLASPITGYLGTKFGARPVVLAGCLLATVGVGACFFAQDILFVIISWGGIYGLGFSLGSPLVPQILSEHYPKHFDKVSGIFMCSISIAGFALPMLGDHAMKMYGVSGSFFILSAVLFHTVPAAMILRATKANVPSSTCFKDQHHNDHSITEPSETKHDDNSFESSLNKRTEHFEYSFQQSSKRREDISDPFQLSIPKRAEDMEHSIPLCVPEKTKHVEHLLQPSDTITTTEYIQPSFDDSQIVPSLEISVEAKITSTFLNEPETIFQNNTNTKIIQQSESSVPLRFKTSHSFKLFLDPSYILMLLTQGIISYIATTLWTVIVDASRDNGVEKYHDLHILEAFNVFEFFGRLLLGFITNTGYISIINFSSICYVLLGLTLMFFSRLEGFVLVMFAVSVYGLLSGFVTTAGLGIVQKYISKENRSMGFSALYFVHGLLSFTEPSLIGFFRENLNSYEGLFYLLGALSILCCILSLLIPVAARCRDNKTVK